MESDVRRIMSRVLVHRLYLWTGRYSWIPGPIVYAIGLLISAATGNLATFVTDSPWACLAIAIAIGSTTPHLAEMHGRDTIAIRRCLNITDEEFKKLLETSIHRLASARNMVFGLVFLPALLWALTQRLWWGGYSQPVVFDIYYLAVLVIILLTYATFMFAGAVSCNQNVYILCERTPLDREYLLEEGLPTLKKQWGGLILRSTIIALIMSSLTSVPILFYSGSVGLLANLGMALTLTGLIFVAPHYMFHRLLERAKEETLVEISEKLNRLKADEQLGSGNTWNLDSVRTMLDKIHLTMYQGMLRTRGTWLLDPAMVVELLAVVASSQEILNLLVRH
jgi:hypothetical protein